MDLRKRLIITAENFIYMANGKMVTENVDYMDAPQRLSGMIKEDNLKELVVSGIDIIKDSYEVGEEGKTVFLYNEETNMFENCKLIEPKILDHRWHNMDKKIEDWFKLED